MNDVFDYVNARATQGVRYLSRFVSESSDNNGVRIWPRGRTWSEGRATRPVRNGSWCGALTVLCVRWPGWGLAQAQRAVERLVAQGQRGHGAAAAAGRGSRRLSERNRASAHRARPWGTAARCTLFSEVFFGRAGAGPRRPMARRPSPAPAPPRPLRPLLFTCRILKGFSAARYGFSEPLYIRAEYVRPALEQSLARVADDAASQALSVVLHEHKI